MFTPGTVLLHDTLNSDGANLLFVDPDDILIAHNPTEAAACMTRLEHALAQGYHAAGYLAYELGYLFEERLSHRLPASPATPLLWLGIYNAPRHLSPEEVTALLKQTEQDKAFVHGLAPQIDQAAYTTAFNQVKAEIAAGNIYQVNLTFKASFTLQGNPVALYRALVDHQQAAYGALIRTETHWILSRSPELFITSRAGQLFARPMKGTIRRGSTPEHDAAQKISLGTDEKNRAENLMIVDLLRNDLGRIAEIGTVSVKDLFTVETYATLHTMTSGITARRRPDVTVATILRRLFPCGSITGAPKLRAMEVINSVETGPRGIYTGAIGHFAPNGDLALNVAIRTAVIDTKNRGEIGIGGGIVADSIEGDEYREALLKMAFLAASNPPITLIETLRWDQTEGFWLFKEHMTRLERSARFFGLNFTFAEITAALDAAVSDTTEPRLRVRLTLTADGAAVTTIPLPHDLERFCFTLAPDPITTQNPWLAHKTTNRAFYDVPRQQAHAVHNVDEVVFRNERGELTEGAITTLFIERKGELITPPLQSGLLPGTLRAHLLAEGRAKTAILKPTDLESADAIWLGNSVRGFIRAEWIRLPGDPV